MTGRYARAAAVGAIAFVALWPCGPRAAGAPDPAEVAAPYRGYTVSAVELKGAPPGLSDRIARGLALRGRDKIVGGTRVLLHPDVLSEDVSRIRLYLARHGYPRASVLPRIQPLDDKRVRILFQIDAGTPVRITQVTLSGVPEETAEEARAAVGLAMGDVFTDDALERSANALVTLLMARGYPFAAVTPRAEASGASSVEVVLRAAPGQSSTFGAVRVSGTAPDLVPLVRRATGITSGDPYSPDAVARARSTLRLLGLFRQIRLEVTRTDVPDVVDLLVTLVDRSPRTLEIGGGYWSDESVRGHVRWQHRNLLGGGRGFRSEAFASTLRQQIEAGVWWPAVLGANVRLELGGLLEHREEEKSYELLLTQGELALQYRPSFQSSYRAALQVSRADVDILTDDEDAFQETRGLVTSALGQWSYEGADDRLNPASGRVGRLTAEVTLPGGFSESHFARVEASAVTYVPARGATFAARLRGGWARPLEDSVDLLPNKRFFAGGVSSMRGFRRNELGPVDSQGEPVGGEVKFEAGAELRIPIVWLLAAAAFVDAGQVWATRDDITADDIEVAAGGALMVITPIGPVRVDVARRLTDVVHDTDDVVVHVAIGHPF